MSTIIVPNIGVGMNKAAYRGPLECPYIDFAGNRCGAQSWKFVNRVDRWRIRYRCKKCGKILQYDIRNNPRHPYDVFGKSKFRRVVDAWKNTKGKHPRVVKP